jgi:hypothetical protein
MRLRRRNYASDWRVCSGAKRDSRRRSWTSTAGRLAADAGVRVRASCSVWRAASSNRRTAPSPPPPPPSSPRPHLSLPRPHPQPRSSPPLVRHRRCSRPQVAARPPPAPRSPLHTRRFSPTRLRSSERSRTPLLRVHIVSLSVSLEPSLNLQVNLL